MAGRSGRALRRAVRVRVRVRRRVTTGGGRGRVMRLRGGTKSAARSRGGSSGDGRPRPGSGPRPGTTGSDVAPPRRGVAVVHHPWKCTTGRVWGRAPHRGRRHVPGPGRNRAGPSGGAPARRGQARPGAGQRPGHAPGSVQRPVVWSRGARSAFADMSRSVSAAPAGVNPRARPPNGPVTLPHAHPAHRLRPARSSTRRATRGAAPAAEKRGRNSWPRNAAAMRSPGSAPDPAPTGPGTRARRAFMSRGHLRRRSRPSARLTDQAGLQRPLGPPHRSGRTPAPLARPLRIPGLPDPARPLRIPPGPRRPTPPRTASDGPAPSGTIRRWRHGPPSAPARDTA